MTNGKVEIKCAECDVKMRFIEIDKQTGKAVYRCDRCQRFYGVKF